MTRKRSARLIALLLACAALVAAAPESGAAPVGSAFTYQGSLRDAGVNASGAYDFLFTLYDARIGGSVASGTLTRDDFAVADGLFSVELDFGSASLGSEERWLQIEVRQGGSTGVYTALPRQKLTPAPFAIGLSLPHSQAYGSFLSLLRMHNTVGGPGGEFSSAGLWGLRGISASTDANAAGVRGEGVGTSGNVIGVEGVATASPTGTGLVGTGSATGAYITGTGSGSTGVHARGYFRGLYAQNLGTGSAIVASGQGGQNYATVWANNTGTGPAMFATGIGQSKSSATMMVENTNASQGMAAYLTNVSDYATAHLRNSGSGQILWLEDDGPAGDFIVATGPTGYKFWVDGAGVTHTKVLEILGGSDLSEKFDVRDDEAALEPGTVVSIDPDHEGRLTVSRGRYDHRVAGIISGAGGLKPGMLMGQKGSVADGAQPVALTGRVYCRATAANGPIRPGDLLTTSGVPGHAMRVDDPARAQGAIIGKAMGSLEKGEGLVLVLVGLQ